MEELESLIFVCVGGDRKGAWLVGLRAGWAKRGSLGSPCPLWLGMGRAALAVGSQD